MKDFEEKLSKTIESTKSKLGTIRTGRANPELLSRIQVDYYGSKVPLQQVANVTVSEGNTLVVNIFDQNAVQATEKAIQSSDLGLNPQTEGSMIRLRLPDLTEERRRDLLKVVKKEIEDGKVSLRNIRREYLDRVKNDNDMTEDDEKRAQNDAQKNIDDASKQLDTFYQEKESEILSI